MIVRRILLSSSNFGPEPTRLTRTFPVDVDPQQRPSIRDRGWTKPHDLEGTCICDSLLDVEFMWINFSWLGVLNACCGVRHLGEYLKRPKKNSNLTRVTYSHEGSASTKTKGKKVLGVLTTEYPRARFSIQTLHLPLMRLTLVRELLASHTVFAHIRGTALFECARYSIALSDCTLAQ